MGKFCIFIVVILGVSVIDSRSIYDSSSVDENSMEFFLHQVAQTTEIICNMYGMSGNVDNSYCELSQQRLLNKIYKLRLEMDQLNQESPDDVKNLREQAESECNSLLKKAKFYDNIKKNVFNGRNVSNDDVIKGINVNAHMIDMIEQCTKHLEIDIFAIKQNKTFEKILFAVVILGLIAIAVIFKLIKAKLISKIEIIQPVQ